MKQKKKRPRLVVSANWRLENAKSRAAMLQETTHRRHTHEYTAYAYDVYVVLTLECLRLKKKRPIRFLKIVPGGVFLGTEANRIQ